MEITMRGGSAETVISEVTVRPRRASPSPALTIQTLVAKCDRASVNSARPIAGCDVSARTRRSFPILRRGACGVVVDMKLPCEQAPATCVRAGRHTRAPGRRVAGAWLAIYVRPGYFPSMSLEISPAPLSSVPADDPQP